MPRTAQKVDDLAAEGEDMTAALSAVLRVADERGTVTWSDVSDDLSSGQWGRLIEKGLLVDAGGEGFVVDDPDGVREALGEADPEARESDEDEESNWTVYDKAAGAGALGLSVGYLVPPVRAGVGSAVDLLLGPLEAILPFYVVIMVLALLTGLWSTILQDALMNFDGMSDVQEKRKELTERRERAKERGDDEALQEIQQEQMEMMSENLGMFKAQFRPMVWIMLLTIPVFLWMYWLIRDVGVPAVGEAVLVLPLVGAIETWQTTVGVAPAWLVWYFIASITFTQVMRKALNVQTSPT